AEEIPERDRDHVVSGRAAEPGRVVLRAALHPREHGRWAEARLCGPARVGVACGRLCAPAPGAAEGAARPGLRQDQGLRLKQVTVSAAVADAAPHRLRASVRRESNNERMKWQS